MRFPACTFLGFVIAIEIKKSGNVKNDSSYELAGGSPTQGQRRVKKEISFLSVPPRSSLRLKAGNNIEQFLINAALP